MGGSKTYLAPAIFLNGGGGPIPPPHPLPPPFDAPIYTVKPLYKKPLYKKNLFIRTFFTHLVGIQPFPH